MTRDRLVQYFFTALLVTFFGSAALNSREVSAADGPSAVADEKETTEKSVSQKIADLKAEVVPKGRRPEAANVTRDERVATLQAQLKLAEELQAAAPNAADRREVALLQVLILSNLEGFRAEGIKEQTTTFLESLEKAGDASLLRQVRLKFLELKLAAAGRGPVNAFALLEENRKLVDEAPYEDKVSLISSIIQLANFALPAQQEQAAKLLDSYVVYLRTVEDQRAGRQLAATEGVLRRLRLPGQELTLVGDVTADGSPFNWSSHQGKVVLVDFWATWCGPCIAEFPRMTKLYETYHEHGFEIVGVSVDSNRKSLDTFLEKKKLPWTILHDHSEGANPGSANARHYSINSIPRMILIGRDFKVISINARGKELEELLKKEFPNVALPMEDESKETRPEGKLSSKEN
ncbi:MAG: hypothetical protein C0478_17800 [Planctomyces sp.]|nr:hypothetical protein [Planctomyces sp.]